MARAKILLTDDEVDIRGFFEAYLDERGFDVVTANDGMEALVKFKKDSFDLVISDMLMPNMIGLELLRRIKEIKPDQKVILMTGVREESMIEKAKALGCLDYITKPLSLANIDEKLSQIFPES